MAHFLLFIIGKDGTGREDECMNTSLPITVGSSEALVETILIKMPALAFPGLEVRPNFTESAVVLI